VDGVEIMSIYACCEQEAGTKRTLTNSLGTTNIKMIADSDGITTPLMVFMFLLQLAVPPNSFLHELFSYDQFMYQFGREGVTLLTVYLRNLLFF
jgi:hypothetical protein